MTVSLVSSLRKGRHSVVPTDRRKVVDVELDPEDLENVSPLALSNSITLSALVALLIRKELIDDNELVREIRALRAKLSGDS